MPIAPTEGKPVLLQKITEVIESFKIEQPDVTEICLISKGNLLYKNANIDSDKDYYSFTVETLVHLSKDQLRKVDKNISPSKIICNLENYSLVIYLIKPTVFLVVVFKRNSDNEGFMIDSIASNATKIKSYLSK